MNTLPIAFRSNFSKRYKVSSIYELPSPGIEALDLTEQDIYISTRDNFHASFPNVFDKYKLPHVTSDKIVNLWNNQPMGFWQNQLNFVIWASTTGCGISYVHLNHKDPMIKSFFRFHVYYQVRRLLKEMACPTPFQNYWSAFENNIDMSAYETICRQFHVSTKSMWKQHKDRNSNLLGTAYYYSGGKYIPVPGNDYDKSSLNIAYDKSNDYSSATKMSFGDHPSRYTVSYIAQSNSVKNAWKGFILDGPEGFTDIGVERINDSIRTYVYAILGAQGQTKSSILASGTGADAQRQFLNIIEDSINSPIDLQGSINRYQDSLQYAGSSLNFVLGDNLYLIPSDMNLRIGKYLGYNNNIQIAESVGLGFNPDVNSEYVSMSTPQSATQSAPQGAPQSSISTEEKLETDKSEPMPSPEVFDHENEKIALVVGSLALAGISYMLYKVLS